MDPFKQFLLEIGDPYSTMLCCKDIHKLDNDEDKEDDADKHGIIRKVRGDKHIINDQFHKVHRNELEALIDQAEEDPKQEEIFDARGKKPDQLIKILE